MAVIVKVIRHSNPGLSYLWSLCGYGRDHEIMRGGFGVNPYDRKVAYAEMLAPRMYFNQLSTNPAAHIVVSFDGRTDNAAFALNNAPAIAAYFKNSYQLIWAVHPPDVDSSHYHMHIMMNSVNVNNGSLFHSGPPEMHAFAAHVMQFTGQPYKLVFEQRPNW
ncbi:MAG: relaxase/mobilization nuclease domain-containing protein [Acutalibacteraceae bacterium]|nr:relaxase/mobilization nuclease domain-containing protein [Acutalibacteraceae bacterium]